MRSSVRRATAAGALALLAAGIGGGQALAAGSDRPTAVYSDTDVTAVLAFGSGAVADQHPGVLEQLGQQHHQVSEQTVAQLTDALTKLDPNYHTVVTNGLQSHNPYKVQAALTQYTGDVKALANSSQNAVNPNGSWWVWTQQAVVQTGTVATTVAALAEVGVVVVLAYEKNSDQSAFTQETIAAGIARAV